MPTETTTEAPETSTDGQEAKPEGATVAEGEGVTAESGGDQGKAQEAETAAGSGDQGSEAKAPAEVELSLPENSLLHADDLSAVTDMAKEQGFSQEQAQMVLAREDAAVRSYHERQGQLWKDQVATWQDEIKKDPEIGGGKYDATVAAIERAKARFATDDFKTMLTETGAEYHPGLQRFLRAVGIALGEDGDNGSGRQPGEVTAKDPMARMAAHIEASM